MFTSQPPSRFTPTPSAINLFIIGSMKSGTTSLHNYLNLHPQIFMCEPKEPGYFVEEIAWSNGEPWYLSLFQNASSSHRYLGESTTDYTKLPILPRVAEKIHAFNPNAKLIYIMRDPFQRIVSHYWHAVRHTSNGGVVENIYDACMRDEQYLSYSNYPMQVKPYLELFGRDNILFLTFEELIRDRKSQLENIFEWLGLPKQIDWQETDQAWNAKPEKLVGVSGKGLLNRLAHSRTWEIIAPLVPKPLRRAASSLSVQEINTAQQEPHIERLHGQIVEDLRRQVEEMSQLMNRDLFTLWRLR